MYSREDSCMMLFPWNAFRILTHPHFKMSGIFVWKQKYKSQILHVLCLPPALISCSLLFCSLDAEQDDQEETTMACFAPNRVNKADFECCSVPSESFPPLVKLDMCISCSYLCRVTSMAINPHCSMHCLRLFLYKWEWNLWIFADGFLLIVRNDGSEVDAFLAVIRFHHLYVAPYVWFIFTHFFSCRIIGLWCVQRNMSNELSMKLHHVEYCLFPVCVFFT